MAVKVFVVNYQSQADYKVCLCDYESQQKNHQIIEDGKLVKFQGQADIKIFFVKYTSQADIIIHPKNLPK
jgi:hypothetical protein